MQGIPTRVEDIVGGVLRRIRSAAGLDGASPLGRTWIPNEKQSDIAHDARQICNAISPDWLRNHCYRTFAIGMLLGRSRQFDSDLLFVACMLHDAGLTDTFAQGADGGLGSAYVRKDAPCFAVRGAGVAESLAIAHDWPAARSHALAEAISLHLNPRVSPARGIEAHLLNAASALDAIRLNSHKLPEGSIPLIESRWARGGTFCDGLATAWERESETNGDCRAAFLRSWAAFLRRIRKTCPSGI